MNDLPLKIGERDDIIINNSNRADARRRKIVQQRRTQTASTNHQNARSLQTLLPRPADITQHELPEACDAVLCRNVAIYLDDAARVRLARSLARSVRDGDELPAIVKTPDATTLVDAVVARAAELVARGDGRVAVICPDHMVDTVSAALNSASLVHGRAQAAGLDQGLSIVPASLAKGLELDDVIVVEPAEIVDEDPQGLRLLYVTLTRSTRSLTVVHRLALPDAML